jgi:hypothetical protein
MNKLIQTVLLVLMGLVVLAAASPALIKLVNAALIPLILVCGGVAVMWQVVIYLTRR